MVASRLFIEQAGLMVEDYFLYYEEVDWAFRRGDLPLRLVPDAVVYHHGGTVIGSGSLSRRATPFANYFNYRNRARFARRHMPLALPLLLAKAVLKAGQLLMMGAATKRAQYFPARSTSHPRPTSPAASAIRRRIASLSECCREARASRSGPRAHERRSARSPTSATSVGPDNLLTRTIW